MHGLGKERRMGERGRKTRRRRTGRAGRWLGAVRLPPILLEVGKRVSIRIEHPLAAQNIPLVVPLPLPTQRSPEPATPSLVQTCPRVLHSPSSSRFVTSAPSSGRPKKKLFLAMIHLISTCPQRTPSSPSFLPSLSILSAKLVSSQPFRAIPSFASDHHDRRHRSSRYRGPRGEGGNWSQEGGDKTGTTEGEGRKNRARGRCEGSCRLWLSDERSVREWTRGYGSASPSAGGTAWPCCT